ncbi:MAG: ABC transporter ATP-binding protein [Clostridia bacterium]|nr:ABC transporter ATP-binding protein [Clostridia bacterium]
MNAIEVKGLCKKYKNYHSTWFKLENVDLILPSGCIMGLIGENGAGKSTTIKLILDIIGRDAGTVKILGEDASPLSDRIKNDIGVVLDEPCFPDSLTTDNIGKIMAKTYDNWNSEKFDELLARFDIDPKKKFKALSKGMKIKLSIAVALSHSARLLILDEPTNGLDPVIRSEIIAIFNEFTRDPMKSVLISSHIVSDLEKICDYIAFMHKGKIILCAEKDRLLEWYGVIRCTADDLEKINPEAIVGKRESQYGVEAVVERRAVPAEMEISSVSIEDLFVFIVKGEK